MNLKCMMKKILPIFIFLALVLTGCNTSNIKAMYKESEKNGILILLTTK